MYFRLMGKLNARRNGLVSEEEKGFTLIELLVVVIIIGILAAIAIPVYLSVQNNAKNSATQSDVTNLKTAVVSAETDLGTLPGTVTFTNSITGSPTTTATTPVTDPQNWSAEGATLSQYTTQLEFIPSATDAGSFTICGESSTGKYWTASDTSGVSSASSSCFSS